MTKRRKNKSRAGEPLRLSLSDPWMDCRARDVSVTGATVELRAATSTGRRVVIRIRLDEWHLLCAVKKLRGAASAVATAVQTHADWINEQKVLEIQPTVETP